MGKEYLQRNLQNDKRHCQEGRPPHLPVHEIGEHSEMQGADPEEVDEQEGQIKSLDVIGHEIDDVPSGHLPQGDLTQP